MLTFSTAIFPFTVDFLFYQKHLMKRQGVVLPERRVQLYEHYVKTLLSTWNVARGLDRQAGLRQVDYSETLKVLAPLALWMQEASPGKGLVKEAALQAQLETIYRQRGEADPARAAGRLLQDARDYASLLLERGPGEFGFIHLTFLEYLAAVGAASLAQQEVEPLAARLAPHVDEGAWREVILLTVGYLGIVQGRDQAASDLVSALIAQGEAEAGRALVLAAEAVADAWPGGVTAACQATVVQALVKTLRADKEVKPLVRAHAGRVLARLGDPRPEVMTIEGMEFCYVPPGPFVMGSGEDDPLAYADEKPQHTVDLPYGYWIGRFPVTNAQFAPFVEAGGYDNPAWWAEAQSVGFWEPGRVQDVRYEYKDGKLVRGVRGWRTGPKNYEQIYRLPNHPRIGVSWYEAIAYTRWLINVLLDCQLLPNNWQIHLPNEPEWEKAARGGEQLPWRPQKRVIDAGLWPLPPLEKARANKLPKRRFPRGNEIDINWLNYQESKIETTSAVGIFPNGVSPYGVEEMSGNYWEWTRSLWGEDIHNCTFGYPYQAGDGREVLDAGIKVCRVMRGGAYLNEENGVRLAVRLSYPPDNWLNALRLVVAPPSTSGLWHNTTADSESNGFFTE
ncbi:MAG: SUMF1/EgtB/PvdO family nonheme iron enzyme [Caldilineaceae bacterium]